MCGVIGVAGHGPVNQAIYDGLLLLQHRGQDAAGIATEDRGRFYMYKANGLVRDVFRTRNMRSLPGLHGLGHVRYPTAGSAMNPEEAQPFYVNAPHGITLAHNGNLTNSRALQREMYALDRRHINTDSDSEVLLNVFAHALQDLGAASKLERMRAQSPRAQLSVDEIFAAVSMLGERARGAYAVAMQIANVGLLAFRDPFGIRPMCLGYLETDQGREWMVASESVAVEGLGFKRLRDLKPGEAILIDRDGSLHQQQCMPSQGLHPCIFEYVYFARPDSMIDEVSVYDARLKMGALLADDVKSALRLGDIDVVMPIPDTSRPSAMEMADRLNLPYREGFIKNRYVGRTFIMPGQAVRRKSVRQKLNAMSIEFKGKSVLLVDDSIVRGTTSREIIQMARDAGARKVYFASASPPVRYPNVYGIDMPTRTELIAHGRSDQEIGQLLGADGLVYQSIDRMKQAVASLGKQFAGFEASCFDGHYMTGDVDQGLLDYLESQRLGAEAAAESIQADVHAAMNLQFLQRET